MYDTTYCFMNKRQKFYLPFKRLIGIIGSLVGIVFCLAFLWWWVIPINLIVTKGHPFFSQKRYGKNEKVFKIIKLRSMKVGADPNLAPSNITAEQKKAMDTKFGYFLRRFSIDETPQLFNILIGQMAFIGPRPGAAVNEEDLRELRKQYTPNAFDVLPGLSGYAQIKMKRSHIPLDKARLDHEYVERLSFWLDLKIFLSTIFGVFYSAKGE